MLKRSIYETLLSWKKDFQKTALCIIGARQIGKTTIVREFAASEFSSFVELNFLEDEAARAIFSGSLNPDILITNITAYTGQKLIENDTLILLDEIQECPAARTAIKFLVEQTPYAYVETVSLPGVSLKEVKSYPVGFERQISMYPLSFREFLWAAGMDDRILNDLKDCYETGTPVTESVHSTLIQQFQQYLTAGGMPAAVAEFFRSHDLARVLQIQKDILALYRNDILKYASISLRAKILEIFNGIPAQLNALNQRFMLSQVIPKAKIAGNEDSFVWLILAGVALPCYNVSAPVSPLTMNEKRNLFKLFQSDTGLLCAQSIGPVQFEILQGNMSINQDSILENAMAQQLVYNGFELFYFNSKKFGEIDFVTESGTGIDLIEIKSGNDYRKHPALNRLITQNEWQFQNRIVFCKGNIEKEGDILYLPWYMIMFYQKPQLQNMILPSFNLENLNLPEQKIPGS